MDTSISMVEKEKENEVVELAENLANERLLDILFPNIKSNNQTEESKSRYDRTRKKDEKKIRRRSI